MGWGQQPTCNKAPGWGQTNELTYFLWSLSIKIDHSLARNRDILKRMVTKSSPRCTKQLPGKVQRGSSHQLSLYLSVLMLTSMSSVWFAWGTNRRGTSLSPASLLFPWADSVPLWQHCKCRVTLWPKERKKPLEDSVAQCTAVQIEQQQSALLLNQALPLYYWGRCCRHVSHRRWVCSY